MESARNLSSEADSMDPHSTSEHRRYYQARDDFIRGFVDEVENDIRNPNAVLRASTLMLIRMLERSDVAGAQARVRSMLEKLDELATRIQSLHFSLSSYRFSGLDEWAR